MRVTFTSTTPVEYTINPTVTYDLSVADGDITVERLKLDGAWVEVDGSPVTDGEEVTLRTKGDSGKIRVTPSAIGTEMILEG